MHVAPQMGYDRAITVFSPDGRLFQVEYAREAVKRGTPAIGINTTEGVILLVDKRVTTRLLEPSSIEKIYQIDEHIGVATSGLVADARMLVDRARLEAMINRVVYDEPIEVETLAKKICDFKQQFTQYGGVRPFGTSLLIAGVDTRSRLYETDPSGALLGYKATAIGANRNVVMELLEEKYRDDMTLEEGILLGMEALVKATEGEASAETVEVGYITLKEKKLRKMEKEKIAEYLERVKKE
ncbi:MAG: archaeal proteasome endopeptidase complex subunit alpha [Archaeoglobi archaeon]|nr:archaeal proteasome endopeptidase complex subunit alpha [Candidatus Mnemosynella bozhongmuii]